MKVLCFGSLNIDHVYQVDHFPRPGETMYCESYKKFSGGKGLNQSIALARAGADVYHAGKIGGDGGFLVDALQTSGVKTDNVMIDQAKPSGHALIQVDKKGENSIILFSGTNVTISEDDIDSVLKEFSRNDILLLQNEINNLEYLMKKAHQTGMTIIFNPAPMNEAVLKYPLDLVDIFIVNEIEGQDLTGDNQPENMMNKMIARYPESEVVLTLGAQGVLYGAGETRINQPAKQVDKVVDTTAAGDTFIGYFVSGIVAGMDMKAMLERCVKASAICVSRPGASASIPRLSEVE